MGTCILCDKRSFARGLCQNHYMRKWRAGELSPIAIESDTEYIINRVVVDDAGHWRWQKSKTNGYGKMMREGKCFPAHVFSYVAFRGQPADGEQINHLCHERDCVNPAHLYAGSQRDNMRDMLEAGRSNPLRGSANGRAKLTAEQVAEIFGSKGAALPIAKAYGVSQSLIYAIRKGRCWGHLRVEQKQ